MAEKDPTQALFFIGGGRQAVPDIQHVYSSLDLAKGLGHGVKVARLFLKFPKPLIIEFDNGEESVASEVLTLESGEELARIELERHRNVADHLLTARELSLRGVIRATGINDEGLMIHAVSSAIMRLGGAAVVEGTEQAVHVAAGNYEDLRPLNHPTASS